MSTAVIAEPLDQTAASSDDDLNHIVCCDDLTALCGQHLDPDAASPETTRWPNCGSPVR